VDHDGHVALLWDNGGPGAEGVDKKFVDANNIHIVHFSCKGEDEVMREIGTPTTTQESEGGVHTVIVLAYCALELAHNDGRIGLGLEDGHGIWASCDSVFGGDDRSCAGA